MKKDDKIIQKVLRIKMCEEFEICNKIYTIFKKICFDIIVIKKYETSKEELKNIGKIGVAHMQDKVKLNLMRFKKTKEENMSDIRVQEKYPINVEEELKTFLKSCGCKANDEEMSDMLHFIKNLESKREQVILQDLFDIWGTHITFCKIGPNEVFKYVFEYFIKNQTTRIDKIDNFYSVDMKSDHVQNFLELTEKYFMHNNSLKEHIKKEAESFGGYFSAQSLTLKLTGPLKYYPK